MDDFQIEMEELEFKYKADDIKLTDFLNAVRALNPIKTLEVSSWDIYYDAPAGLPFEFFRLRNGSRPELTIKEKKSDKNNHHRFELDLHLDKDSPQWEIEAFLHKLNAKENFRIWKYCNIFWYEKVDVVYYIVYNTEMKELGRIIEIEARKDYPFRSPEEAWVEVVGMERRLNGLGVARQKRMKLSNWERFRQTPAIP